MRKALFIVPAFALLFSAPLACAQTQTVTYTYNGMGLPIYPNDWNVWAFANIFVPKSFTISKVTVSVQVQFNGVGALNIYLWSPQGTRTKLLERNCGNLANIDTTFDDGAPTMFSNSCPATSGGSYQGNQPLANSNGQNAFGYWQVGVENNGNSNTGLLTAASITITGTSYTPPAIGSRSIVSLATLENETVAPGDQILIFGTSLGPVDGVRADAIQQLPTSLGQTTVTFDGTAVPMYYASSNILAVQAPFTLNAGTTTQIQVSTPLGSSVSIPLTVVPTKPGILTYDAGGHGQARAINQDGSLNGNGSFISAEEPARAGTYISLYATGLGALNPPLAAGTPPPASPLSNTVSPVTATIAGRAAIVAFAGAAPGLTGVYQVNVLVPADTPSGTVPVTLSAAGASSQSAVTIQIK